MVAHLRRFGIRAALVAHQRQKLNLVATMSIELGGAVGGANCDAGAILGRLLG